MVKKAKTPKAKKLTGENKEGFFSRNIYVILAFIVPFVLMTVGFAVYKVAPFGIFATMVESIAYQLGQAFPTLGIDVVPNMAKPWGDRQMLVVDLWHQYYPFLVDLQDKLQSGGSLFWTWSVGMGSNFIAMMSYYLLSPLNFLSVFVPEEWLVGYLAVATVIKISCAGMFTAIALRIIFKRNDLSLVFFSVMFALCSFNMGYYWCTIWLDSVAMLPLVVAGTVSLLRDGKFKLFTISLALAVVFNYYIGLFICIAVFFTAIGYTVSCWNSIGKSLKDLLRTAVCSVTALLMTAPVTIPAYLALQNCYKSTNTFPKRFDINIGTDDAEGVLEALHLVFSNVISFIQPTDKEGLPNIACGLLCIALIGVFFCAKKVKLGEKLFCLISLLFMVASFIFRHLDYIWHGFHYPNMLPYRFSFLVSFLLIYMAYRAFTLIDKSSYLDVIISALVFALIIMGYFLREQEDFNKATVIASIAVGSFMLIVLLLYTLKILPKKALSILLCLVVVGEMCATAVIGVGTVGTTTTSGYPKDNLNVSRVVSHIDKWAQEGDPDIFRTEVPRTQSLNDGALNSFNGISVFNSMANVSITKYVEYLGCTGWKAGNRYTYYESSPVTNTLLNLKYIMARGESVYNTTYLEEVDRSGNVVLYENTAYLPMGFLANSALEYFNVKDSTTNPFENQIEFWKMATGIEEPLYTQLTVTDVGHSSSDLLSYSKSAEGVYSFTAKDKTSAKHTKFNYYPEEDSFLCGYYYVSGADSTGNVYINDESIFSMNVKQPFMFTIGEVKAGEKVSLYCNLDPEKSSSSVRTYCYALNKDVFEQGLEILGASTMEATKATDTVLEGTVDANRDGLLYTSIPYEKGWSVQVDGEDAEVVAVGNGVCAVMLTEGEHTVKFSYVPDGFKLGMVAFIVSIIIFAAMCLLTSKSLREKKFAYPVVWLFTVTLKEKKPKAELPEGELPEGAENSEESLIDTDNSEAEASDSTESEISSDISAETEDSASEETVDESEPKSE
ncbi:MAG: YfhO family protein [Ruminococcus sp.]|nr:YfhO family protein [Ruminococcus sp.]